MRILIILFTFSWISAFAQDFKLQATLEKVPENGFYKIKLPVQIISAMENFPADIRIYDEQNNEVPYIFKSSDEYFSIESTDFHYFNNFRIKSYGNQTYIRIKNKKQKTFSRFYVMYKNGQTGKNLKLYAINRQNQLKLLSIEQLQTQTIDGGQTVLQVFDFPDCSYSYYEIRIEKNEGKFAQIKQVGYLDKSVSKPAMQKLPAPELTKENIQEQKISRITIRYDVTQRIDAVRIFIGNPDYYYRDANFLVKDSSVHKKKKSFFYRNVKNFKISSDAEAYIRLNDFRAQTFYLQIENKDNPPLKVDSLVCFQKKYYLVAQLEKDKKYFLRVGSHDLPKPEYDLQYFTDKIPKQLKSIELQNVDKLNKKQKVDNKGFNPDKSMVWMLILIISAVLIFIVAKMMKNTDN